MDDKAKLFEERQYIGFNKHTLSLRIFLAMFCFIAYYFTDIPEINGELLFFVGIAILVISVILLFVTHIHTVVTAEGIRITGFLGTGKVVIPWNSIRSVEKVKYSNFLINNPVYNLHRNGTIKFYSGGKDAVRVETSEGPVYLIGSRKPEELVRQVIKMGKI